MNYKGEILYTLIAADAPMRIKLGCKDGGAFFFIGWTDIFFKNLDTWNKNELDCFEHRKESMRNSLDTLIATFPNSSAYLREKLKKSKGESIGTYEEYQAWLERRFNSIQKKINKVNELDTTTYQSLETRVIEEFYPSVDEPNTYICLIEGDIEGEYWTGKEYERGFIEKEEDHD